MIVAAVPSHAQRAPSRGTIEGDVYLVMKSGDTKRGAGRMVLLLKDSPSLQASMHAACLQYALRVAPLVTWKRALEDSAAHASDSLYALIARSTRVDRGIQALKDEAVDSIVAAIAANLVDSTSAGMSAHYVFEGVRAGRYVLYSQWQIADYGYRWWAPIAVAAGRRVRRDLDNSSELGTSIFCGIR